MRALAAALGLSVVAPLCARAGYTPPVYDQAPISYTHTVPDDPIARLAGRVSSGALKLAGPDKEILRTILRELAVPEASQVLVFSKTSLEASLISPSNPRALYFSDSVYVGYVPGGLVEAAAIDPKLGPVFYALDPADVREGKRSFVREKTCLRCHAGNDSREVPEVFMRSVATAPSGEVLSPHDGEITSDRTPFEQRWGGWYVTGDTGVKGHRGNRFGGVDAPEAQAPLPALAGKYLSGTSDMVALLVLQHQVDTQDCLTRAGQRVRRALYANALGEDTAEGLPEKVQVLVDAQAQEVVDHILFLGAASLPDGIQGSVTFQKAFLEQAPQDSPGRALRQLSLHGQLFAHRCSYMIDSASFRELPRLLKRRVLEHLRSALQSTNPDDRYAYLTKEERSFILGSLADTVGL